MVSKKSYDLETEADVHFVFMLEFKFCSREIVAKC